MDRKDILLRAAFDLLKRTDEGPYVVEAMTTLTHYDDCDCDGACLCDDIADILGIDPETRPIALDDKG